MDHGFLLNLHLRASHGQVAVNDLVEILGILFSMFLIVYEGLDVFKDLDGVHVVVYWVPGLYRLVEVLDR